MRWKISILLIAAMLCVALTGVAAAEECVIKCAWEPCGEKVNQCDKDPVYALTPGWDMRIMYTDVNSNNRFDEEDGLFIDAILDWIEPSEVEVGDIRLVESCGNDPNTKVKHGDNDQGNTYKELPGGQAVVGFVDINNDGVYDKYDPLYVDTDASSTVTVNDVRLTARDGYANYTRVGIGNWDLGDDLRDPAPLYGTVLETPIGVMLGYIDTDCNCEWSCPDKLYLQQMKWEEQFDFFVTIGDFRLYIPQEAIDNEDWPVCGTKVQQCDKDAVYALVIDPTMMIMYTDVNSNDRFDEDDGLFIDTVYDEINGFEVEVGDIRLVKSCGNDPNTKVKHGDNDQGNTYKFLPGDQAVVGFVDINNDWVYGLCEPLYVDTDNSSTVTVNDVRLTARNSTLGDENYTAYSRVGIDNWDLDDDLRDPVSPYGTVLVTDIWELLGYIDSDCNCHWSCPDKLYLQQIKGLDQFDLFVTIGDFRLYIPPEAVPHWEPCGTKVKQCNVDAVYALVTDTEMRIRYTDVNSNGRFDEEDGLFIDTVLDDINGFEVEVGDVRLVESCGNDPNTKVKHGDNDQGNTYKELPAGIGPGGQAVVGFVDINNDGVYDKHDPLYVDTDASSDVTVNDVRLTARNSRSGKVNYTAYSRVNISDWDLGDDLRDPVSPYGTVLVTPIGDMLGYIDSDCNCHWSCPDKLYLQQIVMWLNACPSASVEFSLQTNTQPKCWGAHNEFVTIGDLRLYVPPGEVPNNNPGDNPGTFDPMVYDTQNPVGVIDRTEVFNAIDDYFTETITRDQVFAVIAEYFK